MSDQLRFPPTSRGYDLREVVSALQKAIRRSNPDDALYWATEMARSGYGNWCWKRLKIITSEDIGPAEPQLPAAINALYDNWIDAYNRNKKNEKPGEEYLFLYHAVLLLCGAKKCSVVDWAIWYHQSDHVPTRPIPDAALDKHTLKGKQMRRGQQHFIDESSRLIQPDFRYMDLEETYLEEHQRAVNGEMTVNNPFGGRGGQSSMLDHETGAT
jgi:replication-associated recombination protein RarA